jgi:hypothetical protein
MSVETLTGLEFPARLVSKFRPIWIAPPNHNILLSIYLQSKCLGSA